MSDTFESIIYLTSNSRGDVRLSPVQDAQAKLVVTVHNGRIIHGEFELVDESLTDEEKDELLEEDDRQLDLFDILTSDKFIGRDGGYDER
jgi:hypothetical protein